jgi:hypothetical protein
MRKTFCDRCGSECTGFHLDVSGHGYSVTGTGEVVAELYTTKSPQLCRSCTDALAEWGLDFGLLTEAEAMQAKQDRHPGEEAMEAPVEWAPVGGHP